MKVALHGFTGCPAMWSALRVQALPLLGHSREVLANGSETFTSEVNRIASLLAPATELIGYSLGARLALSIARAHPSKVAHLTLISGNPGLRTAIERQNRIASDAAWIDQLHTEGMEAFVSSWEQLPLWASQATLPPRLRHSLKTQRLQHDPVQLAHALKALGTGVMPPLWDSLPAIDIPTHLVVGSEDTKYRGIAREMQSALPKATLTILPACGHNPILEQPTLLQRLLQTHEMAPLQ